MLTNRYWQSQLPLGTLIQIETTIGNIVAVIVTENESFYGETKES